MKFLFWTVALCIICTTSVAAQSDNGSGDTENLVTTQRPPTKEVGQQLLGQQKPLLSQNKLGFYPDLSNYPNMRTQPPYQYPANSGQRYYGYQQPEPYYENYPTQNYASYQSGYNQVTEQPTWNAQLQPQTHTTWPNRARSNYPTNTNGGYWRSNYMSNTNGNNLYSTLRDNFLYGRRQFRRQPYQPRPRYGYYNPQPNPTTQKPKTFGEERFLSEYSTGSVQQSDSGIQLIADEAEKGKQGNMNRFPIANWWRNNPANRQTWIAPRPIRNRIRNNIVNRQTWIAPRPIRERIRNNIGNNDNQFFVKPNPIVNNRDQNVNNWIPRNDYTQWNNVQPQPRPDANNETKEVDTKVKTACYTKCKRQCGLGFGNPNGCRPSCRSGCNSNSMCGRRQWACGGARPNYPTNTNGGSGARPNYPTNTNGGGGARPNYQTNTNGGYWRTNYMSNANGMNSRYNIGRNGQYWGAAAEWNNVVANNNNPNSEKANDQNVEDPKETNCGPDEGEWKMIDNNWKWVCKDKLTAEETGEVLVIDA